MTAIQPDARRRALEVGLLAAGRLSLVLCSVVSIGWSTRLLGPAEMGLLNLVLSTVNQIGLLLAAFGLFFYRQVLEWQLRQRLLHNLGRFALFVGAVALLAACCVPLFYLQARSPWQPVPMPWLLALLAGNLFFATLLAAVLYCLNATGRRLAFVLWGNLASWGGLGLALALSDAALPQARWWLAGLLGGQVLSLAGAALMLARRQAPRGASPNSDIPPPATADFRARAVVAFSWPLLLCTGLYGVTRNAYAPWLAAGAGAPTLGLFAVAFSVGMLSMAAFDALLGDICTPLYYQRIAGRDASQHARAWSRHADTVLPALVVMTVFVAAVGPALLRLLVPPAFQELGWVVACGAAGQLFISVYGLQALLASSFMDNRVLITPNAAGAAVAVATLALWPPEHRMAGAALALDLGLLVAAVVASLRLRQLYGARPSWGRAVRAGAAALPLWAIAPVLDLAWPGATQFAGGLLPLGLAGCCCALLLITLARSRQHDAADAPAAAPEGSEGHEGILISVLVPACAHPAGVAAALRSLGASAARPDVELLVFDDSRLPAHREAIAGAVRRLPAAIYCLNEPPLGPAGNWNSLLHAARGRYCVLLHHDECFESPAVFERLLALLSVAQPPDGVVLACKPVGADGRARLHVPAPVARAVARWCPGYLLHRNLWGAPSVLVLRRSMYPDFDPSLKLLVDVELYVRMLQASAPRLHFLPAPGLLSDAQRSTSITATMGSRLPQIAREELRALEVRGGLVGRGAWIASGTRMAALARHADRLLWAACRAVARATRRPQRPAAPRWMAR